VLADETAILYTHGTRRVFWVIRATTLNFGSVMCVTDLVTGHVEDAACLRAEPRHVYRAIER